MHYLQFQRAQTYRPTADKQSQRFVHARWIAGSNLKTSLRADFMPFNRFPATINAVEITFDPKKGERNLRERNLSFERAAEFDFASASYFSEVRSGEHRLVAVGYLKKRLHILCFLPKVGRIRVISFRKANDREVRKYGKPKTIDE